VSGLDGRRKRFNERETVMGDGQFIGGGSVKWEVKNSDGDSGSGSKHGAKGRDKDPKGSDANFTVTITGIPSITVPVKGTTISVSWPGSVGLATRVAARKKATTRVAARKKVKQGR
jgi:hypothetical protein